MTKREMTPARIALDHLVAEVVALVRDADGEEGPAWAMCSTLEIELAKTVDKHLASFTARLESAERARDEARLDLDSEKMARYGREMTAMEDADASKKRADAAERKLEALEASYDAWKRHGDASTPFDLDAALRAARGEK